MQLIINPADELPIYRQIMRQITEAIAGLERTREVLDETPENEDPGRSVTLGPIRGNVAFHDVSFAYEQQKTVLHDVSFRAWPGSVTALVGSSGSGKSTIIGLIAAFHKPNQGTVTVDGIDLGDGRKIQHALAGSDEILGRL